MNDLKCAKGETCPCRGQKVPPEVAPGVRAWSCGDYAKHRGSPTGTVSAAIKTGRLVKNVVRAANGDPKIADFLAADREWDQNTDPAKRLAASGGVDLRAALPVLVSMPRPVALPPVPTIDRPPLPPAGEGEDVASATERLKSAQADLAELKYQRAAGELAPVVEMERRIADEASRAKTRLLAIPSRARQSLPHLTLADLAAIEALIREALEELAGPVRLEIPDVVEEVEP